MARRAVRITIEEMRPIFSKTTADGRGWQEGVQGRSEIVFDFPYAPNCIIRVWTSIHTGTEASAGVGKDAIRVTAFDPINNRGLMKCPIVMRTTNWRNNLLARLELVKRDLPNRLKWAAKTDSPRPADLQAVKDLAAKYRATP